MALAALCCGMLSCSKEKPQTPPEAGPEGTLTLRVPQTLAVGSTPPEESFGSLRVSIFNGGTLEQTRLFTREELDLTGETIEVNMRTRAVAGKTVHVLLNEPAAVTPALGALTSEEAMREVTYTLADFLNSASVERDTVNLDELETGTAAAPAFLVPWYGLSGTFAVESEQTESVTVNVSRAVARVDLYLRKKSDTGDARCVLDKDSYLSVDGGAALGYLASGTVNAPAADAPRQRIRRIATLELPLSTDDSQTVASDYRLAYSFYMPEQQVGTVPGEQPLITVNRTRWIGVDEGDEGFVPDDQPGYEPIAFRFGEYIPNFDGTIRRNTVYTFYGTIGMRGVLTEVSVTVAPWTLRDIPGEI